MTEENPRHDGGIIPPPPSRPPTSALPVVTVTREQDTTPPPAPSAESAGGAAETAKNPPAAKTLPGKLSGKLSGVTLPGLTAAVSRRARPLVRRIRRQGPKRLGAAAAVLVVLALLVWWAVASFAGGPQSSANGGGTDPAAPSAAASAPATRGALPLEGVSPLEFQLRDCFKDFDPDAQQSTIVDCSTAHSAQLVAVEKYAADDSYPGREALKQKARGACKAAPLTEKAGDYDLSYKLAYPSSSSWDKGDRRVDCYAVTDGGNVIKESLLP
ncbi:septum formation family protein [Arthrobacter sp. PM3]|uniref:septum formation family protein n=1 Tax=Arthrobacter sp. PM3 TaxID=2017685 RepID=UPI001ABF7E70|nr:septum formation family protein [Arthrobacter sp. PM3]